jgi:hypothetical protein
MNLNPDADGKPSPNQATSESMGLDLELELKRKIIDRLLNKQKTLEEENMSLKLDAEKLKFSNEHVVESNDPAENSTENAKNIFFESKMRDFLENEAKLRCRIEILELEVEGLRGVNSVELQKVLGLETENRKLESAYNEFAQKCQSLEVSLRALEKENLSLMEASKRANEKNRGLVAEHEINISSVKERFDSELDECKSEYAYQ